MGRKKRKNKRRHTSLSGHARERTRLVPPLAELAVHVLAYERDLLPEYLWIAALVDAFGEDSSHRPFYDLLDALDAIWSGDDPPLGLLSNFGAVPIEARPDFKSNHRDLIRTTFHDPIGRVLAFYPECPAFWLIDRQALDCEGSLDPSTELSKLRNLVVRLLQARDDFAGHTRMLPLGRVMKHGKLHVPRDFDLVDVLPRYPGNCSDDEKRQVQSFGRTMINMNYEQNARYKGRVWPMYFWRHNYDLATCVPRDLPIRGSRPLVSDDAPQVESTLESNAARARSYLSLLSRRVVFDLYAPERHEILLGLFARCTRLFVLMSEDVNLWARDTAGIFLRCLAETAITLCYLAKVGTPDDFAAFRRYGEGQEKLLMLHLQDSYPGAASLEGRASTTISDELGSFNAELLQIELGNWSNLDTRKLAQKAGMERLYRLVFSPTSSDVHGTWLSLKNSNLSYCSEPLHRFHRLPAFAEPPVYLNSMLAAQELFEACVAAGRDHLGFPELDPPLDQRLRVFTELPREDQAVETA